MPLFHQQSAGKLGYSIGLACGGGIFGPQQKKFKAGFTWGLIFCRRSMRRKIFQFDPVPSAEH
jgi:hypothetical protein